MIEHYPVSNKNYIFALIASIFFWAISLLTNYEKSEIPGRALVRNLAIVYRDLGNIREALKLTQEIINLSYVKITPEIITDQKEFNENFFTIIDEIENLILNGKKLNDIAKAYSLNISNIDGYDNISS